MVALVGGVPRTLNLLGALGLCRSPDRCHHPPPQYRLDIAATATSSKVSSKPSASSMRSSPRSAQARIAAAREALIAGITPGGGEAVAFLKSRPTTFSTCNSAAHPSRSCRSGDGTDRTDRDHYRLAGNPRRREQAPGGHRRRVGRSARDLCRAPTREGLEIDPGEFDIEDLIDDDPWCSR